MGLSSAKKHHNLELESILAENVGIVIKVANSFASNAEDRNDLIQEIRLQIVRAAPRFDASRRASTWVYRVALNTAISWRRKSDRWSPVEISWDDVPAEEPEPLSEAQWLLRELISKLDPMNRSLLILHLDDRSHAEIGEILGISTANVATKLTRIRQQLIELSKTCSTNEQRNHDGT